MRPLTLAICLLLLAASTSLATTFVVHPDGTGDYPTIQAAIAACVDGDVVELSDGTFTGDGNRDISYLGKAIAVRSQSDSPETCVIDCQGIEGDPHRCFHLHNGEGLGSLLQGVTVRGGYAYDGAGILCENAMISLVNCRIEDNHGGLGGGLDCRGASVTNCLFYGNTIGPTSNSGGGALRSWGPITLVNCTFIANWAYGEDGSGNWVYGGACKINVGPARVTGCTFLSNGVYSPESGVWGAAVHADNCDTLEVAGCTFYANEGAEALFVSGSTGDIHHTIIAATVDGHAYSGTISDTLTCCNLFGNEQGDWDPIPDQYGVRGNISKDPLFCDAPNGDFRLHADSPCAPEHSGGCGLIGAWPVGCPAADVADNAQSALRQSLGQNFPNPFNPSTTIAFNLPTASRVTLRIYDTGGRLVRTLVDEALARNFHTVEWNGLDDLGRPLGSGVYFYRLATGDRTLTRKLVMSR